MWQAEGLGCAENVLDCRHLPTRVAGWSLDIHGGCQWLALTQVRESCSAETRGRCPESRTKKLQCGFGFQPKALTLLAPLPPGATAREGAWSTLCGKKSADMEFDLCTASVGTLDGKSPKFQNETN